MSGFGGAVENGGVIGLVGRSSRAVIILVDRKLFKSGSLAVSGSWSKPGLTLGGFL